MAHQLMQRELLIELASGEFQIKPIDFYNKREIIGPAMTMADIGCGTGQYLCALAGQCRSAVGVDISEQMLRVAAGRIGGSSSVELQKGDAAHLDLETDRFDLTISSKLFLHITDWQSAIDEVIRITRSDGHVVYVNEIGYFTNDLRKLFRELCRELGLPSGFAGEYDLDRIRAAFEVRGCCHTLLVDDGLAWRREISYRDAYREIEARSFAEFNAIDDASYAAALSRVAGWVTSRPEGWDHVQTMTPHLRVDVYRVVK